MELGYMCYDCPRKCGIYRSETVSGGFCGCYSLPSVVRAAPHFGEEPCITGTKGSGAVFFSGCSLKCIFCQNHEISRKAVGKKIGVEEMRSLLLRLRDTGVHNINLVTPTHHASFLAEVLNGLDLGIPVVWNSSGYESVETLQMLEGLVQVYMPDMKYTDSSLAKAYSAAADYPEVAAAAIREMFRQRGQVQTDENGILTSGVLIRHLILPGQEENAMNVIDFIADSFPEGSVLFSLMGQYTPMQGTARYPELRERVSAESVQNLCHYMKTRNLENGYWQEVSSATEEMIPLFDGTGV